MQFNSNRFGIPEVTRNIIAIKVLLFIAKIYSGETMYKYLALFNYKSDYFHGWQMITHMFMHGSFTHLLFNMFGLYMFGSRLEQMWGAKRFINFYLITGLGAALLHTLVQDYEITQGLVSVNQRNSASMVASLPLRHNISPWHSLLSLVVPHFLNGKIDLSIIEMLQFG